jgi:hypothetical protein
LFVFRIFLRAAVFFRAISKRFTAVVEVLCGVRLVAVKLSGQGWRAKAGSLVN